MAHKHGIRASKHVVRYTGVDRCLDNAETRECYGYITRISVKDVKNDLMQVLRRRFPSARLRLKRHKVLGEMRFAPEVRQFISNYTR